MPTVAIFKAHLGISVITVQLDVLSTEATHVPDLLVLAK